MQVHLMTIVCKFGGDPTICLREEAICAKVYRRTDDGRRAIALAHSWNELKTVQNYFCQKFVKFPSTVKIFVRKMANSLKLCEVHSFSP